MHKIYDLWPDMARDTYKSVVEPVDFKNVDHVIFAGMGGSGSIGDIFSSLLSQTPIHTTIVKGYHLPKTVDSNTLVVIVSISGNTAETLTVLKSTAGLRCKVIAFSNGGKMEQICKKNKIPYKKIRSIHSSRASLPSYLYSILAYLGPSFNVKKSDVTQSIALLEQLREEIRSSNLINNPAIELAEWMTGIPVIYYPWGLQSAAIRFKNSLQENSKIHATVEDVIEASHNSIVAWERQTKVQPILIRGTDDYSKTKERWQILKEYFETKKIDYREIFTINGSILSKIINLIYLLDYSTIYRAVLSKIDPAPTDSIDFIKARS